MTLEYKVDSIDGMDKQISDLYEASEGGGFKLKVSGLDTAENLKGIITKVKEERDIVRNKLAEIDKQKTEAEKAAKAAEDAKLEQDKQFKTLWEKEQKKTAAERAKYAELQEKVVKGEMESLSINATKGLSSNTTSDGLLREQALKFIENTPDGVQYADGMDAEALRTKLTEMYPQLVDGSPAGGGGANGGGGSPQSKTIRRSDFDKLSPGDKSKFATDGGKVIE